MSNLRCFHFLRKLGWREDYFSETMICTHFQKSFKTFTRKSSFSCNPHMSDQRKEDEKNNCSKQRKPIELFH
jgi:hypothetical protein